MKKTMLFQQFKQWSLKSLVSVIIFVSVVLLGGTIITLALPSSLDAVKSINANNQLTAQNRDYLVDKVKSTISDISTVNSRINTLSGTAASNYTDLTNRITTVSGNVNTNTTAISTLTIRVNTLSESTSTNTTTITNLTNLLNALNNTISNQAGDSIPAGAVMAFDLSACPSGWTRFADADNRFIMGANTNSKEKGGNSSITLAWNQLPPHSHYVEDTAYLENGRAVLNLERGASNGYYRNDWQLPGNLYGSNKTDEDNMAITFLRRTSSNLSNSQGGPRYGAIKWSEYDNSNMSSYSQTSTNIQNPYIKLIYCKKN